MAQSPTKADSAQPRGPCTGRNRLTPSTHVHPELSCAKIPKLCYNAPLEGTRLTDLRADLHLHTTASDGRWPPEKLVTEVQRAGIGLFAVTDHDSLGSLAHTADLVRGTLRTFHPAYDQWILEDAYGRVLSRPGLTGLTRELCAVAALTVTGAPSQLRSHIMGAFHLGAAPKDIQTMIRWMAPLTDKKKIDDALEIYADNLLK